MRRRERLPDDGGNYAWLALAMLAAFLIGAGWMEALPW